MSPASCPRTPPVLRKGFRPVCGVGAQGPLLLGADALLRLKSFPHPPFAFTVCTAEEGRSVLRIPLAVPPCAVPACLPRERASTNGEPGEQVDG